MHTMIECRLCLFVYRHSTPLLRYTLHAFPHSIPKDEIETKQNFVCLFSVITSDGQEPNGDERNTYNMIDSIHIRFRTRKIQNKFLNISIVYIILVRRFLLRNLQCNLRYVRYRMRVESTNKTTQTKPY